MTVNRRIFLNIVAPVRHSLGVGGTYGRFLYALAIGLFCWRWTLIALGQVDLELVGIMGYEVRLER